MNKKREDRGAFRLLKITTPLVFVVLLLIILSRKENLQFSIHSPVSGKEVLYEHYPFQTTSVNRLVTKSGTEIIIPANSLVYSGGADVHGKAVMKLRELRTTDDFFFSGIPLQQWKMLLCPDFMIELLPEQDGKPLRVKPEARLSINVISRDTVQNHNRFFLFLMEDKSWYDIGVASTGKSATGSIIKKFQADRTGWWCMGRMKNYTEETMFHIKDVVKKQHIFSSSSRYFLLAEKLHTVIPFSEKNEISETVSPGDRIVRVAADSVEAIYTLSVSDSVNGFCVFGSK